MLRGNAVSEEGGGQEPGFYSNTKGQFSAGDGMLSYAFF